MKLNYTQLKQARNNLEWAKIMKDLNLIDTAKESIPTTLKIGNKHIEVFK